MSASASKKKRKEMAAEGSSFKQQVLQEKAENKKKNTRKILIAVLSILVVVGIVLGVIAIVNAPYRQTVAKIGGEKISAPLYSCFYGYTLNTMNNQYAAYGMNLIQPNIPLSKQKGLAEGQTMEDSMIQMTNQSMESAYNLYLKAKSDSGFSLSQEGKSSIDNGIKNLEKSAKDGKYSSVEKYLRANVGAKVTEDDYKQFLTVMTYSSEYNAYLQNTYQPADDELAAKYTASPDDYDTVVFTSSRTTAESTKDSEGKAIYTDEAKLKAKAEAEAKKDKMPDDAEETYAQKSAAKSTSSVMAEWLFDASRKQGDTEMFTLNDAGTSFITVRFEHRDTNDYYRPNVYVFTIDKDKEEEKTDDAEEQKEDGSEEETADTSKKTETAEEKLARFMDGVKDGMSDEEYETYVTGFGYTADKTEVSKGVQIDGLEEWLYDDARKAGDTKSFEAEDTYYVVRYIDKAEHTYRQELVRTVMYNEMYNALIAANKLVVDTDALRYANTDRTLYSIAS